MQKKLIGFFSIRAIYNFTKDSFQLADAIGDAADRAGVAVESLSRLKYAADQSDVNFESLTIAIKRWQVTLSQASSGSTDAAGAIGLLGISAAQLKSLTLEEQLRKIADQFSRIKDPADQTRVAVELFGRAGEQLVPLLNKGGSAIGDLTAEADRLGITLDEKTSKSIDQADKALKKLLATVQSGVSQGLGKLAYNLVGPLDNIDAAERRIRDLEKDRNAFLRGAANALPADKIQKELDLIDARIAGAKQALEVVKRSEAQFEESQNKNALAIPDDSKITDVTIKQRKAELEGLAKLLDQFEQDTKLTEDKIYQDYLETTNKIKELQKAGIIDAEEAAKRASNARIKFENDALIDPVKITQSRVVVTQVLSEQQRAVDKFVDTLSTGLENLARSGELTGRSILKYLLSAFEAQVLKDAIAGLGNYLKKSLGGTGSSGSSALGSFINGIFGAFGHAAGGGRMSGPRVVGEDGPELDMGGGNIMNRRQLAFAMGGGGGAGVNYAPTTVVNISGSDNAAQTAQYVEARIQANNRKQLEQMDRLLKNNYGRGLR